MDVKTEVLKSSVFALHPLRLCDKMHLKMY
jgi:hypothetical protein